MAVTVPTIPKLWDVFGDSAIFTTRASILSVTSRRIVSPSSLHSAKDFNNIHQVISSILVLFSQSTARVCSSIMSVRTSLYLECLDAAVMTDPYSSFP